MTEPRDFTELELEDRPDPPRGPGAGSVGYGVMLGFLLHVPAQAVLGLLTGGSTVLFIGTSQLLYILPAGVIAYRKGHPATSKGLMIAAAITFLVNAACFGVAILSIGAG